MRNHEIPLCPLCLCVLCVEHNVQQRATMSCKNVVDGLFKHRGHRDTEDTENTMNNLEDNDTLTQRIIGCAIEVHRTLGPGLLESAYVQCIAHAMIWKDCQRCTTLNSEHT